MSWLLCVFCLFCTLRITRAHIVQQTSKGSISKYVITSKEASTFLKRSKRSYESDRAGILEECREGCDDEEHDEFCSSYSLRTGDACACDILRRYKCRRCGRLRCVDVRRNCYNLNSYQVKCVVDGGYSQWTRWSPCSVSCGRGTRSRRRRCDNPRPCAWGRRCMGPSVSVQICSGAPCPVHGGLSLWTPWSSCSMSCGFGWRTRRRECNNPAPLYGGRLCPYTHTQRRVCHVTYCPTNGGFSSWTLWSDCSVSCGEGSITKSRTCSNPRPAFGGRDCIGDLEDASTCNPRPCPVDGGFSSWTLWSDCSVSCGEGSMTRSRTCSDPSPAFGGRDCTGDLEGASTCNPRPCPVDGGLSSWTSWSSCSVSCGEGSMTRSRTCSDPSPAFGGRDCIGELEETLTCNPRPCPVNGGFSIWSSWSDCSVTCGHGSRTRSRTCSKPSPTYGGLNCTGDFTEVLSCNPRPCPVNGGFSSWSSWSDCSVTCGQGAMTKSRTCSEPSPAYGGLNCTGDFSEVSSCNPRPCPVNGGFASWSSWSDCSVTCGQGAMTRNRTCSEPSPAYGGLNCTGDFTEVSSCNPRPCPVNGGFSSWSSWSDCSVTCGQGAMTRSRTCSEPSPAYGGLNCTGDFTEVSSCNPRPCPVNGGFSSWSSWSDCSVTCGHGSKTKSRTCSEPSPAYGGLNCTGDFTEVSSCNPRPCPVNGGFSSWSSWSDCSVTCGQGAMTRSRTCSEPSPAYGGLNCTGDFTEVSSCNPRPCPVNGGFSSWSSWSDCSVTCGHGSKTKSRTCSEPSPAYGGLNCTGDFTEVSSCNPRPCPVNGGFSSWSSWSDCSVTCGQGAMTRSRTCSEPSPAYGGLNCTGDFTEVSSCNPRPCPVNGGFSSWALWSDCSVSCGQGTMTRSRTCSEPSPAFGGLDCTGDFMEDSSCNPRPCPVNGGFSSWTLWSDCSVSCGDGSMTRSRTCSDPIPAFGGLDCIGDLGETSSCNPRPCPVNGGFTQWTAWSVCSVTCGNGTKLRSRTCTNPEPQYGGLDCAGEIDDVSSCSLPRCSLCNPGQFECNNGICIHGSLYCDGYPDCRDNSDEQCDVNLLCPEGQKRCADGRCVSPNAPCL